MNCSFGLACVMAFALVISLTMIGCKPSGRHAPGGPYYFRDAQLKDPYPAPIIFSHEVSEAEARAGFGGSYTYHAAYFDDKGRVSSFEKGQGTKILRTCTYQYRKSSLLEASVCQSYDGPVERRAYGEDGRPVPRTLDSHMPP